MAERRERSEPPRPDHVRFVRDRLKKLNPGEAGFTPAVLDRSVIAIPLLQMMEEEAMEREKGNYSYEIPDVYPVIIDVNLEYRGGRREARERVRDLIVEVAGPAEGGVGYDEAKSEHSQQYVYATLEAEQLREIVRRDGRPEDEETPERAIYRIWPDFEIASMITRSLSTVKADAVRVSFSAFGKDIVWAVLDSGVELDHPHFDEHENLVLDAPLRHRDFTAGPGQPEDPTTDEFGHGTHVAGILAGELNTKKTEARASSRHRRETGDVAEEVQSLSGVVSGMAPQCKILSMKVLNANGKGRASNMIAALEAVQEINGYGRRLRVHGVNMSVGYDFEPEWFACGQSPLCVEVDRLVRSGVVVVVAAGNTGYGYSETAFRGTTAAGLPLSINDPGNAQLAITVGSTHRDAPHIYGVSYFSSKGPTGDGRLKPDLVAPGEKIISCASRKRSKSADTGARTFEYVEESGTSMAAPHVSGVIAAFLSVRQEFIGNPERVKEIFLDSATDLQRDRYFQGRGLVDVMRAIQSV